MLPLNYTIYKARANLAFIRLIDFEDLQWTPTLSPEHEEGVLPSVRQSVLLENWSCINVGVVMS